MIQGSAIVGSARTGMTGSGSRKTIVGGLQPSWHWPGPLRRAREGGGITAWPSGDRRRRQGLGIISPSLQSHATSCKTRTGNHVSVLDDAVATPRTGGEFHPA